MGKPKLIAVIGPTATGKSDLAVMLAKKLNGEVVSADSRQVYRGLNVGTGKITRTEMKGIRHHLLDVADPKKQFSAEKYRIQAQAAIADIISRKKLPILSGGSGFYIDAVLNDKTFPNAPVNDKLRKKLAGKSAPQLLVMLAKLDPKRARAMAANNSERNNARRLVRAIEIATEAWLLPVEPRSGHSEVRLQIVTEVRPQYDTLFIGLNVPPAELRVRIHARLMKRLKAGMIAEVERLHGTGLTWTRMNELGLEYRYLALFLQRKMSREEMIAKLDTEIWRYAKRQMTWFKRNKKIRWFEPGEKNKIIAVARKFLAN